MFPSDRNTYISITASAPFLDQLGTVFVVGGPDLAEVPAAKSMSRGRVDEGRD